MAQSEAALYFKSFPKMNYQMETDIQNFIKQCCNITPKYIRIFSNKNSQNIIKAKVILNNMDELKIVKTKCNYVIYNGIEVVIMNYTNSKEKFLTQNLMIKDLDPEVKSKDIYEIFSTYGEVFSCIAFYNSAGKCNGKGSVCFENQEDFKKIQEKNDIKIKDKLIKLENYNPEIRKNNVYITNIPINFTEEQFKEEAQKYGTIRSFVLQKMVRTFNPVKYGFVSYEKQEELTAAINGFNSFSYENIKFQAYPAINAGRGERKRMIKDMRLSKYKDRNIIVKNLPLNIEEKDLIEEFKIYGSIESAKVMKEKNENNQKSLGYGYICFTTKEMAQSAIEACKSKTFFNINLMACIPIPKKEYPRQQMHKYGYPQRPPQKNFYPHMYPMPNRGGMPRNFRPPYFGYMPQFQPMAGQFDMKVMNPGNYHPSMLNYGIPPPRMPMAVPMPIQAPPQEQMINIPLTTYPPSNDQNTNDKNEIIPDKQDLGELLYTKIEKIDNVNAAKITGMLLEMDLSHIQNLVRDQNQLIKWVEEAKQVLNQPSNN